MGPSRDSLPLLVPAVVALAALMRLSDGKLELKVSQPSVEVMFHENGLLQCEIAELTGSTLSANNLGVLWAFTSDTGNSKPFVYMHGVINEQWKEAELSESSILSGNMSLLLKSVTFKHTGQYRCDVFISPNYKASKTIKLEVLARPTVTVVSEKIVEVGTGGEMALGCQLSGYYPCDSNAEWLQSTPSQGETKLLTDICIAPPVKNPDGTCNVTTEVRLEPHVEDIGSTFQCRVTHKTFSEPYLVTAFVTLKAEIRLATGSIVGSIIASIIISVAVIATGIFLYMRLYYKVAPEVSDIQIPARIVHLEPAEIICHVSGFRPDVILVSWYLKTCKDSGKEFIGDWQKDNMVRIPFVTDRKIEISERIETGRGWKVKPGISQKNGDGSFSISSILEIYPDINEHNKAEITCEVSHPASSEVISKSICLQVEGVAPKLAKIIGPHIVHHNNSVVLTCPIHFFKPRPLRITWYKEMNGKKESLLKLSESKDHFYSNKYSHVANEFSFSDHSHSVYSMLFFNPTIKEDDQSEYFCEVEHISLRNPAKEQIKLQVKAFPSVNAISCEPVNPVIEEKLTLSCKVHSFYPETIIIQWLKDNKVIEGAETSEVILNLENKLYELTSSCTIIPTLLERQSKYKCQVDHQSLLYPRFAEYTPENLVSFPILSEIVCNPAIPEPGKELTLTCDISNFYPEDIQIDWFRDEMKVNDNPKYGNIVEIPSDENGLYKKVTQVTLTPSTDDHQAEYKIEVCHTKSSTKPLKQCFQLFFKGSPKFSEFKLEPENPLYGKPLSVYHSVCGLLHEKITVEWYKASEHVKDGVKISGPVVTHENTYKIDSCLNFLVTAEDFERELIFQFKDNTKSEVFKRRIQLPLKAVVPKVTEIKCDPPHPKKGGNATLTCKIEHFCPVDIHVVWSKGWTEYKNKQIVETPKIDAKGLYSTITKLPIVVGAGSEEYTCEIRHTKTNDIVEKTFILQI
uniref:uncharacterized protein isoform X2 n=1 Tax=Pristiophorus japonicus TaxID=55135 RepID=UPI00398E88E5